MVVDTSHVSPNHSPRDSYKVSVVILHATVGTLASSLAWLCSPASRVSSHYVIGQDGTIYRLVAESEAAWHAGRAEWKGETAVNEVSIGIELVNRTGMDGFIGQDPYPDAQVRSLTLLARDLMVRYPHTSFARHLDVALPKGRKTDPAGFPWETWLAGLQQPASKRYTVRGLPVYQRSDHTGIVAAYLHAGDVVEIDDATNGHLRSGLGFVDLSGLQEAAES